MSQFTGKLVLVTGAASGIGKLLALKAAAKGAEVILLDIDKSGMQNVSDLITAEGGKAHYYFCDLSSKESIREVTGAIKETVGIPEILINNAGVVSGKPLPECSDEEIERSFDVNVLAIFHLIRAFLPGMKERGSGHIVNVSSAAGLIGVPKLADYSASKFAVVGLTDSLRVEFKKEKSKIKTTLVCPYYINTGMFKGVKTRFSFLLPILKEKNVANKIIGAIEKNKTRLIMPPLVYLTNPLRIFPDSIFDRIASILGIHDTMNKFEGRGKQ